jgi:GPH family glycoside/pentoside/hexuronide:cation symporter
VRVLSAKGDGQRLPWHTKLIYGLGEFGPSVAYGTVIPFFFLFFLTDVAGVRPGLAGSLLLVARLWDGINDPLVGAISDRTRSRLGRRRPFMLAGAIPMAILYALLWVVPPIASSGGRALYYLAIYSLFDLFYTLVSGPYTALTPELSLDTDERTSIVTYRMGVSIVTGLAAAGSLPFVFDAAPSMRVGFLWAGAAVGLFSAVPYLLIVALFRERPDFQRQSTLGLRESILVVLRNRAFWLALLVNWLSWLAIGIVEAVFAYYVVYWAGIPQEDSAFILFIILFSAMLFLPLVSWLSKRFEKKWAFVICTLTWMTIHLALWLIPQATVVPVYVIGFLAGLGVASAHVLPTAMSVDVLEAVEVESGQRQEGVFGGISNFIQKLGSSLALMSIGWVLELTGYVPNAARQSATALAGIRSLVSWVPALLLLAAAGAAAIFPITRAVHGRLVAEANRHRLERSSGTPGSLPG